MGSNKTLTKKIDYVLYGLSYVIKTRLFRKDVPSIGGLVISDRCNLNCRQCEVADKQGSDLSYGDVADGLHKFYRLGIRSVFIEGGEPFLWRDGDHSLEDIVGLARQIGFKVISIYTNGTLEIKTTADVVFVSLDGLRETNNSLRGRVFDRVIQNIKDCPHPNININFTINSVNQKEIEPFCEYCWNIKEINGIFFYFHTPYYGFDDLFLDLDEKRKIIRRILKLKRQRFNILNSTACLKMVYRDTWKRPSKLCYVYDKNTLFQCCRAIGNEQVCKNCGYLGYPEIISILKLRPSSLIAAVNYLPKSLK